MAPVKAQSEPAKDMIHDGVGTARLRDRRACPSALAAFHYHPASAGSERQMDWENRFRGFWIGHVWSPPTVPPEPLKRLILFLRRITGLMPGAHVIDAVDSIRKLAKRQRRFARPAPESA